MVFGFDFNYWRLNILLCVHFLEHVLLVFLPNVGSPTLQSYFYVCRLEHEGRPLADCWIIVNSQQSGLTSCWMQIIKLCMWVDISKRSKNMILDYNDKYVFGSQRAAAP